MKRYRFIIILNCFFFFLSHLTFAQILLKCAGKAYNIPAFKQDSIKIYDKRFEQYQILTPIHQSKYDLELRGYYVTSNPFIGSAVVIKGDKEKLIVESYFYTIQGALNDRIPAKNYKVIGAGNLTVYYSVKTLPAADTLLNSLIKNKLFTLADFKVLKDSLLKNNIKLVETRSFDPYRMQFELKVKDHYCSFNCDPFVYEYNKNQNVKELHAEQLIYDQFNSL